ncbi:dihydrolipoamide acetyltransferase family protein [Fuchsiella alkaliacetigena]|uniref:dihydrolipoamide acetyltransferase family protein n=1 Tax=Fuchsiella alkaliacetigena TaxID=957042 RepID=UPI002009E6B3|nr:dihydrolipoamide acetyltransferase family protein [Fuchsiella alkaliacetigena]MCK8824210.1 2-oxo acid dehydrogenase subunit E2 [Fuchsiella alkaliacetigena]
MAYQVEMPKFGETMTEGTISKWFKQEGEEVVEGEAIFEVNTDKASLEVEAPASGVLAKILVAEEESAPINEVVAVIAEEGEEIDYESIKGSAKQEESEAEVEKTPATAQQKKEKKTLKLSEKVKASPAARRLAREQRVELATITPQDGREVIIAADLRARQEKVQATPVAKKMAQEKGIDLAELEGSGPGGWIAREDVEAYLSSKEEASSLKAEQPVAESGEQEIPMTGIRKIVAQRMSQSASEAPHVTLTSRVDMTEVVSLRERLKEKVEQRITYTDIINLVTAQALAEYPNLNAHIRGESIIIKDSVNLGLAVDIEEGLVVPVIDNADQLGLKELASQREELVEQALAGKLSSEEMQGSTFTVTNLGGFGVEIFTPIINSPEVAILGIGKISEEAVVVEGEVVARPTLWLSLSFDHRAVDGAPAGEFLQRLKELFENPVELLL